VKAQTFLERAVGILITSMAGFTRPLPWRSIQFPFNSHSIPIWAVLEKMKIRIKIALDTDPESNNLSADSAGCCDEVARQLLDELELEVGDLSLQVEELLARKNRLN